MVIDMNSIVQSPLLLQPNAVGNGFICYEKSHMLVSKFFFFFFCQHWNCKCDIYKSPCFGINSNCRWFRCLVTCRSSCLGTSRPVLTSKRINPGETKTADILVGNRKTMKGRSTVTIFLIFVWSYFSPTDGPAPRYPAARSTTSVSRWFRSGRITCASSLSSLATATVRFVLERQIDWFQLKIQLEVFQTLIEVLVSFWL